MSNDTRKVCYQGHILARYSRKDGRCGGCHSLRERRYRSTLKGRAVHRASDVKRNRSNPQRIIYRLKWLLNARIKDKERRIAELERILS